MFTFAEFIVIFAVEKEVADKFAEGGGEYGGCDDE